MRSSDKEKISQMATDIADIKANIMYIRERVDKITRDFDKHEEKDQAYYAKTNRHAVLIGILWAVFGISALTLIAQNLLANVFNFGG